jgi:hypothetical protein
MTNDLIKDMAINHFENLNDFKLSYPIIDTSSKEKEDTLKVKSKYEKVKKKVVKETVEEDYYKYAFIEEFKSTNLLSEYKRIGNIAIKRKEYEKSDDYKKELAKYNKKIKRKGYNLGIDKVVVASPFYLTVDERKKDQVRYLDSEEAEQNFIYTLKNNASLNKLEVDCLDDIDVKNITTESYNDYTYINKWFNIKSKENKLDINLVDLNKEETDAFIKKHGTKYVCWLGTIAIREKKSYGDALGLCLLGPYYLPFFLINAMTPEYATYFYSITYNIETRKPLMIRYDLINRNDTKGQMNSIIYDTFYQIKTK